MSSFAGQVRRISTWIQQSVRLPLPTRGMGGRRHEVASGRVHRAGGSESSDGSGPRSQVQLIVLACQNARSVSGQERIIHAVFQ